jgi:hypothetical protein
MRRRYREKAAALGDARKWCCRGCHEYVVAPLMSSTRLDARGNPKLCVRCAELTDEELKARAYKAHREKLKKQYAGDYDYWLKHRFFGFRTSLRREGHDLQFEDFSRHMRAATAACPICGVTMERTGGSTTDARTACLDHNHATGQLRQVICGRCNRALGIVEDNIALLDALKAYLQHHQPR